jgi:hypothetical protein
VAEDDRLALPPVLVEDVRAVGGRDRRHSEPPVSLSELLREDALG